MPSAFCCWANHKPFAPGSRLTTGLAQSGARFQKASIPRRIILPMFKFFETTCKLPLCLIVACKTASRSWDRASIVGSSLDRGIELRSWDRASIVGSRLELWIIRQSTQIASHETTRKLPVDQSISINRELSKIPLFEEVRQQKANEGKREPMEACVALFCLCSCQCCRVEGQDAMCSLRMCFSNDGQESRQSQESQDAGLKNPVVLIIH